MTAVALAKLTPYPGNPRRGDIDAIAESLTEHLDATRGDR